MSSLSAHDLIDECGQVGPLEGLLQARHLVHDAAERPDVGLLVVDLALAHLGTVLKQQRFCDFNFKTCRLFGFRILIID